MYTTLRRSQRVWLLTLAAAGTVLSGCGSAKTDLQTVLEAYNANRGAAHQQYGEQMLIIRGRVGKTADRWFQLQPENGASSATCVLRDDLDLDLRAFAGKVVSVRGLCKGMDRSRYQVRFVDCELLE